MLVGTSLLGGVFVRYVLGDLVRVLSTSDPELGIDLPQIVVESRVDDLISLGSMVWLTERSLWQAFGYLDLHITDWVACKELSPTEGPLVRLYVESSNGHSARPGRRPARRAASKRWTTTRRRLASRVRIPCGSSSLAPGTFKAYLETKRLEGAELGHLKPPRMQPNDAAMTRLLTLNRSEPGRAASGTRRPEQDWRTAAWR